MSFAQEQNRIIELQSRLSKEIKGRGWNKFRGYVIEHIVAHLLEGHLPSDVRLVRDAFVEGCKHEFDLMIVEKDAKPMGFREDYPCAYPKNQVKMLIEVKASGLYYPNETFQKNLTAFFQGIQNDTEKPFLYLSIWETGPKSTMTRNALGNSAFILKKGKNVIQNEWRNFISRVVSSLKD